jgi:hypothetical protein
VRALRGKRERFSGIDGIASVPKNEARDYVLPAGERTARRTHQIPQDSVPRGEAIEKAHSENANLPEHFSNDSLIMNGSPPLVMTRANHSQPTAKIAKLLREEGAAASKFVL